MNVICVSGGPGNRVTPQLPDAVRLHVLPGGAGRLDLARGGDAQQGQIAISQSSR